MDRIRVARSESKTFIKSGGVPAGLTFRLNAFFFNRHLNKKVDFRSCRDKTVNSFIAMNSWASVPLLTEKNNVA
jgi:hypothetical protein